MPISSSRSRHRAARRAPLRSMLTVTSAVAGATLIGLGAAGTTLAMWNDSENFDAAPISSGSLQLYVNNDIVHTLSGTVWEDMLPGDRVQQPITLFNSGTVATDVSVSTTATPDLEVRVLRGDCPVGSASLGTADSTGAPGLGIAVGSWGVNETETACVEVTMKSVASAASQNTQLPIELRFTAVQRIT